MAKRPAESGAVPEPRKGMPDPKLEEATFRARFHARFVDPAFAPERDAIERLAGIAWDAYDAGRKAPLTRKAGAGFADPDYDLAVDWIEARAAIDAAEAHYRASERDRVLLVNASPRSEHTCPGEMSKSWRLVGIAQQALEDRGAEVEVLDLSRVTSEYGRAIHPCKACFSTAAALCHWPCSCYPNHSLGQTGDWMNAIYPMWVAAHGVMIVTPVHWYQATSPLKLMIDRLVCADGGNPDPTLTHGKDATKAKAVELAGWDYPRHLAGRFFAVVVHGDVEGVENVRRDRRLAALHAPRPGRRTGRARPLHRLLGALRHQPPGARPGRGDPKGGAERRTDSRGSLGCTPRGKAGAARRGSQGGAAEMIPGYELGSSAGSRPLRWCRRPRAEPPA